MIVDDALHRQAGRLHPRWREMSGLRRFLPAGFDCNKFNISHDTPVLKPHRGTESFRRNPPCSNQKGIYRQHTPGHAYTACGEYYGWEGDREHNATLMHPADKYSAHGHGASHRSRTGDTCHQASLLHIIMPFLLDSMFIMTKWTQQRDQSEV